MEQNQILAAISFSIQQKMLKLLMFLCFCRVIYGVSYFQNDYTIVIERSVAEYSNKDYLADFKFENSMFNRTTRTVSYSFRLLKEVSKELTVTVQTFKFINNQYKEYAPIRFNLKICPAWENNYFGIRQMMNDFGNFPTLCPFYPDFYSVKDMVPIASKLPPRIPLGRYKGLMTGFDKGVKLCTVSVYVLLKSKTN